MKKWFTSLFLLFLVPALFAQDETTPEVTPGRGQSSFYQTIIMIAIAIIFFYFILWRPEQRRRKAMEQQRGALKKGDRVTAMGIVGIVDKIKENTVILKMVDGAKIEVLKAAITDVKPGGEEEKKSEDEEVSS